MQIILSTSLCLTMVSFFFIPQPLSLQSLNVGELSRGFTGLLFRSEEGTYRLVPLNECIDICRQSVHCFYLYQN